MNAFIKTTVFVLLLTFSNLSNAGKFDDFCVKSIIAVRKFQLELNRKIQTWIESHVPESAAELQKRLELEGKLADIPYRIQAEFDAWLLMNPFIINREIRKGRTIDAIENIKFFRMICARRKPHVCASDIPAKVFLRTQIDWERAVSHTIASPEIDPRDKDSTLFFLAELIWKRKLEENLHISERPTFWPVGAIKAKLYSLQRKPEQRFDKLYETINTYFVKTHGVGLPMPEAPGKPVTAVPHTANPIRNP